MDNINMSMAAVVNFFSRSQSDQQLLNAAKAGSLADFEAALVAGADLFAPVGKHGIPLYRKVLEHVLSLGSFEGVALPMFRSITNKIAELGHHRELPEIFYIMTSLTAHLPVERVNPLVQSLIDAGFNFTEILDTPFRGVSTPALILRLGFDREGRLDSDFGVGCSAIGHLYLRHVDNSAGLLTGMPNEDGVKAGYAMIQALERAGFATIPADKAALDVFVATMARMLRSGDLIEVEKVSLLFKPFAGEEASPLSQEMRLVESRIAVGMPIAIDGDLSAIPVAQVFGGHPVGISDFIRGVSP